MKALKRALSCFLTIAMLLSLVPATTFAEGENEYSITNGYLSYTFNADTGGFAIETAEGNPKKALDNNIPLLYAEDKERSNGTSFVTVRIGNKDYVFGQDYGFFGLNSHLDTPVISEEGRLMTIPWTINDITVTLKVALGTDVNSDITGNAGISFEVKNNSGKSEEISVRLLLDTALGNEIDAPYFVVDEAIRPTMTETEFSGESFPAQIRCVDSLSNPTKLSYILTKGWNGGVEANKIIVGHWANLANTRYAYTPDTYCDFTNYSNAYKEPDSAAAIYWENKTLEGGASFSGEMLYGVGNFSNNSEENIGLNITAGRLELTDDGTAYKNNGEIDVTVEIDNTVDNAVPLSAVQLNMTVDDQEFEIVSPGSTEMIDQIGKEIITKQYKLRAKPQSDLTAGTIYVSLTATANETDGTQRTVETASQRSVIMQSVKGNVPEVQLNKVNPEIVWTGGEKAITVSGKMAPLKALSASPNWSLRLKHTTSSHSVLIDKKNIAFLDEAYENLSFTTSEELEVGAYRIVFEFTDDDLKRDLGQSITCAQTLQVSANEKYRLKSYGTIALVRSTNNRNQTTYDFFTFKNEGEYLKFYQGDLEKTGELNGEKIRYSFGADKNAIRDHEIILTIRGNLREMERGEDGNKQRYWQADYADGDIIINNMLSYEGEKPLEIAKNGNSYTVKGDGLLKVVNSINVWRSKWSFSASTDAAYTLDMTRLGNCFSGDKKALTLSLDGAAKMIQSVGGLLVSLKYGIMQSQWYTDADGMVTYGIGFGGKISLPISAKKKKDAEKPADLTADQEDISEEMNSLFDESLTADQEDISGDMQSLFTEDPPKQTSTKNDKIKKDDQSDEPEKGKLSAEVENVLFGEKGGVEDQVVKVSDTGFIGINATMALELPKDVLGSLVSNAPGISASVTINTIDNVYQLNAGLSIKVIECEGVLAFKEVQVKKKDVIVPDKIEFYIRKGLKVPLAPPVLYMIGLGGGINGLADTIGGQFDTLPPITLLLFTRLEAIGTMEGDFNAKISLEGLSLKGDMRLKISDKLMQMDAGISARWIEPWELNLYGNVSIIDGLIKGGITVTVADNYFYGYIFASLCIPKSIPLVGGKELAGVEAAVSHEFIGANIKIIGIKFGVIYYWGENVSFGKNIDLSPPARSGNSMSTMSSNDVIGYYGTNVHALSVKNVPALLNRGSGGGGISAAYMAVTVDNAEGQDALLIEISYTGSGTPEAGDIRLINPNNETIYTVADDGDGGGNMLVQSRDGENYIYITVTDPQKIVNGTWTVAYTRRDIKLDSVHMNGVDQIAELTKSEISSTSDLNVEAAWETNADQTGCIDVYLTEDKDILKKIQTNKNQGDSLGINILHQPDTKLQGNVRQSKAITLPDTFTSGTYYAVTTLSTTDGISLQISDTPITIKNPKLPKPVSNVHINYGGNGNLFVQVTDAENADYTHYLAEIVAEDGTVLSNNVGQFEKGANFVFGKEANLQSGKKYSVRIRTLREEYGTLDSEEYKTLYYYGADIVTSDELVMPDTKLPELLSVKTNFDTAKESINQNSVIVEYTFKDPVFVELSVNGTKAYSDNKFKTDWRFVLDDLEDGDYVIDFTAYTSSKDHITGKDAVAKVPDAQLGFSIDTSQPVLSLTKTYKDSITSSEGNPVLSSFGANTILANDDGSYTIEGMTEKSVKLTIDGSGDEITVAENGGFQISRKLNENESYRTHTLKAEDAAGNVTELVVTALRPGGLAYRGITLQSNQSDIAETDGVKHITLKNGQSIELSALGITENGQKFALDPEDLSWSILYEKNHIAFDSGKVTALLPGETAIKAKLNTADLTTNDNQTMQLGVSDYAVITIAQNSKFDLADKIEEAKKLLDNTPNASDTKKNNLNSAIDAATTVLNDGAAQDTDYTDQVSRLTQAMEEFKKTDSKPSSGGGGGGGSARSFSITLLPTEHGTAKLSHTRAVYGTSVTITAEPDEGYVVSDILINGKSVGRAAVYTIQSVSEDIQVQVLFGEKSDLPFVDVLKDDWFYETVKEIYKKSLMLGVSDTEFEPNTPLTRAMFVTILHRIEGTPEAGACTFDDVESGAYYEKAVAWANENGIVNGMSDTEFAPDDKITREQMAAILYRYAEHKQYDTSVGENTNILSYEDAAEISEYAVQALQWAAGIGVMTGKSSTTLNPRDHATRAEASAVFVRFLNKVQ